MQPRSRIRKPPEAVFVLFVSAVEGHMVARYANRQGPYEQLGWRRVEGEMVVDVEAVHAITNLEIAVAGDLYEKHIKAGHLVRRDREAYDAYLKARREADPATSAPSSAPAETPTAARAAAPITTEGG